MAKTGRPKGENNKEYVYSLRMDEKTKRRLDAYCRKISKTKAEVLREAIEQLEVEKEESYE